MDVTGTTQVVKKFVSTFQQLPPPPKYTTFQGLEVLSRIAKKNKAQGNNPQPQLISVLQNESRIALHLEGDLIESEDIDQLAALDLPFVQITCQNLTKVSDASLASLVAKAGDRLSWCSFNLAGGEKTVVQVFRKPRLSVSFAEPKIDNATFPDLPDSISVQSLSLGNGWTDPQCAMIIRRAKTDLRAFTAWGGGAGDEACEGLSNAPKLESVSAVWNAMAGPSLENRKLKSISLKSFAFSGPTTNPDRLKYLKIDCPNAKPSDSSVKPAP